MQFADRSTIQYHPFSTYYADASYLLDFINNPRQLVSSPSFKDKMESSKRFFPLFHAHCEATNAQLHTMSKEERLGLKLRLLEELKAKIEDTKQAIAGEKKLRDIVLPNDPCECSSALYGILNEDWQKKGMHQYLEDEKSCRLALDIMVYMSVDTNQFVIFNESLFTSMPTDCLRRSKRARV
jgi:hypothetical protein